LLKAAFWGGPHNEGMRVLQLARGYHAAREYSDGIRLLRDYMDKVRPDFHGTYTDLIEEYTWMLRTTGDFDKAKAVCKFHLENSEVEGGEIKRLWLERARHLAVEENWEACLSELDACVHEPVIGQRYFFYSSAHLMRGFCLRRLGRNAEAQAAWQEALCERWRAKTKLRDADLVLTGLPLQNAMLAIMLTKQCSPAEMTLLIQSANVTQRQPVFRVVASQFAGKLLPVVLRVAEDPPALREIELLAFQQRPCADHLRSPIHLIGGEIFRQAAAPAEWDAKDRRVTLEFWNSVTDAYFQGKLGMGQVAQGLAAWTGLTGELGWTGLARDLQPPVRGPIALLLAMKRTGQGQTAEIDELLSAANQDLPADSPFRKHLQRLQAFRAKRSDSE
jgi:hypothetical protein